jgi:hypothetical protein
VIESRERERERKKKKRKGERERESTCSMNTLRLLRQWNPSLYKGLYGEPIYDKIPLNVIQQESLLFLQVLIVYLYGETSSYVKHLTKDELLSIIESRDPMRALILWTNIPLEMTSQIFQTYYASLLPFKKDQQQFKVDSTSGLSSTLEIIKRGASVGVLYHLQQIQACKKAWKRVQEIDAQIKIPEIQVPIFSQQDQGKSHDKTVLITLRPSHDQRSQQRKRYIQAMIDYEKILSSIAIGIALMVPTTTHYLQRNMTPKQRLAHTITVTIISILSGLSGIIPYQVATGIIGDVISNSRYPIQTSIGVGRLLIPPKYPQLLVVYDAVVVVALCTSIARMNYKRDINFKS